MNNIRFGLIGIGNMGSSHAKQLLSEIKGAELTAVCDYNPERLQWATENLPSTVQLFDNTDAFFASKIMDVVLIATPHYDHPTMAIQAFESGYHVLVEKPAGVYTKAVREMNDAAIKSGKLFGIMYNQRTNPLYAKLRDLIQSGELERSEERTGSSQVGTDHKATTTLAVGGQLGPVKVAVCC